MRVNNMKRAFISYVREDREVVHQLYESLESAGIPCWIDVRDIMPGEYWQFTIADAIQSGAYFLACFSENSEAKERSHMREEMYMAIEAGKLLPPQQKWIIPIRLSDCALPKYDLGGGRQLDHVQYVDLFKGWDTTISQLVNSIGYSSTSINTNASQLPRSSLRDLSDLFSDTLHDLRNLQTIALGYSELLLEEGTSPNYSHDIQQIQLAMQRAQNLTKETLKTLPSFQEEE